MPIDTSVITGTQAHKHSVDSADGGFLESSVTGMTNLTQGGILRGNAANIQENLVLGNAGEVLKVNAGATDIEWGSASSSLSCSDNLTIESQTHTICEWVCCFG